MVEKLQEYVPRFLPYKLPIGLGVIGLGLLLYGMVSTIGVDEGNDVVLEQLEPGVSQARASQSATITVDIEGAVVEPGVYQVPVDSRIHDALITAGGLSESADREWVAKNVNLATKLKDGAKIYVPRVGQSGGSSTVLGSTAQKDGSININTATQTQLEGLSGVGPVTASKIITGRPYDDISDLVSRKILSSKVFEKIKDQISTY